MADRHVIYGIHAVLAALHQAPGSVVRLWLVSGRDDARMHRVLEAAREAGVPVERVVRRNLDSRLDGARHQGVAAEVEGTPVLAERWLDELLVASQEPVLLLVLDGVQDPHNLGACLRTAAAAGVHAVIAPRDRAAGLTPVVRKVAAGAAESLPLVRVTNLARTLRALKDAGVWVVGAAGDAAQNLFDADLTGALAVVLGAEGKGLRRLTRECCDFLVGIPMAGTVESLNVSVAAGVILFEAVRQRR